MKEEDILCVLSCPQEGKRGFEFSNDICENILELFRLHGKKYVLLTVYSIWAFGHIVNTSTSVSGLYCFSKEFPGMDGYGYRIDPKSPAFSGRLPLFDEFSRSPDFGVKSPAFSTILPYFHFFNSQVYNMEILLNRFELLDPW